jgi:hypothetical protein
MPTSAKTLPWELSDELWTQVAPLLPQIVPRTRGRGRARRKVGGRPRVPDRTVLAPDFDTSSYIGGGHLQETQAVTVRLAAEFLVHGSIESG